MANCGPGGSGTESCCTSLEVEGGTYERTYSYDIDMDAGWIDLDASGGIAPGLLADPATVSTFRLDKYDVTVGRFRPFVNAVLPPDGGAGWVPPPGSGKHDHLNGGRGVVDVTSDAGTAYEPGWIATDDGNIHPSDANLRLCNPPYSTWTPSAASRENLPINCVNWYEAYAFCIWDGGFLPSEAEWEYAAAGGEQQREYPWVWGSVWNPSDPGTSNEYAIYGCYYPDGSGSCMGGNAANIAPVGTPPQGAGPWGQVDLAGEVWQWNMDWAAPYVSPCVDCAALTPTSNPSRVVRGDYFAFDASLLLATSRSGWKPSMRYFGLGFRCARAP